MRFSFSEWSTVKHLWGEITMNASKSAYFAEVVDHSLEAYYYPIINKSGYSISRLSPQIGLHSPFVLFSIGLMASHKHILSHTGKARAY